MNCEQEFDCYKVTKEELAFKKPFTVSFTRQDFCHALVAYFEVDFGASHKKLVLSTGKASGRLHNHRAAGSSQRGGAHTMCVCVCVLAD